MGSIQDWSTSSGTNATADAAINFVEGQLPSTVNNSARQMMARVAEYLSDTSPIRASSGAVNTYAITITSPVTAYKVGLKVAFIATLANTAACTLNVNAIGAKPLRRVSAVALAAGALNVGRAYVANYIAATDEFLLEGTDLDGNALASPAFTGVPTAPTAAAGNSTTQLATTAFVTGAITTQATVTTNALALKANLASPALTGTPTAPTQAAGNNTTRLATTAFVQAYIPDALSTASGAAPSYSARAWVNWTPAGVINGDGNVSSITDYGTGQFRVNFTSAAPSANYAVVASCRGATGLSAINVTDVQVASSKTTSGAAVFVISTNTGAAFDPVETSASFFW